MKLVQPWNEFQIQMKKFISNGSDYLSKESAIDNDEALEEVQSWVKEFNKKVFEFLCEAFEKNDSGYSSVAIQYHNVDFASSSTEEGFIGKKGNVFSQLKAKFFFLEYQMRLFSISDLVNNPQGIELNQRAKYTTEEICMLLLNKLYDLYDHWYHPIITILELNGVQLKGFNEDREYADYLKNLGYVDITYLESVSARLTIPGKLFVEESRKSRKTNYEKIDYNTERLNERIDEVLVQLTKLGLGQEIIYNEIEELKELNTRLRKKNWGEIVRGKIIDILISKSVENDTLKFIYEKLMNEPLNISNL